MMSGKNSINFLLNDNGSDVTRLPNSTSTKSTNFNFGQHSTSHLLQQQQRLQQPSNSSVPQYFLNTHSRSSSNSSTPLQTPQLIRSDSSDSRASVFATPSPQTPSSYTSFEQAHSHNTTFTGYSHTTSPQHQYTAQKTLPRLQFANARHSSSSSLSSAKMDDPINSLYPPIPDATVISAYPLPPQLNTQQLSLHQDPAAPLYRSSNSPASEPSRVSTVSAASTTTAANNAKSAAPKKNSYPCPMAKQFNCNDYFTTSGHAARHAKKHTGKKDAFCPECNKAFTRKDNMEQHRRTHQNGRGAGRSTDDKVKKSTKAPAKKATVLKAEPALVEAAVEQQLQQQQAQDEMVVAAQLQAITAAQQQQIDASLLPSPTGPYFLGTLDSGPIPSLPMPAMNDMSNIRPSLHRSNMTTSLDYIPPMLIDPETLNYSYPSPGLSNGLNSLALAASEHRRISEEKARTPPSDSVASPAGETPSDETPSTESP